MQTKANLAKAKAVLGMGGAQILLQCRPVLFKSVQTQHSPPHPILRTSRCASCPLSAKRKRHYERANQPHAPLLDMAQVSLVT